MIKMSFKIREPIKELPRAAFPKRALVYDNLLKALEKKPIGIYPVDVEGKKPMTIYIALSKRLKDNPNPSLKLHIRGKQVFVEKLSK